MADPTNPAASAPAAQPKVKSEIEQRYDEAGYARNRAELVYNTAVKEHGKDSAEAKAAKTVLDEKQAAVEAIQKELAPKKVAAQKAPAKTPAKTEKLEKIVVELPKVKLNFDYFKLIERPKAVYLYERSETLIRRDFNRFTESPRVKELLQCIDKAKKENKDTTPCTDKLLKDLPRPINFLEQAKLDR